MRGVNAVWQTEQWATGRAVSFEEKGVVVIGAVTVTDSVDERASRRGRRDSRRKDASGVIAGF
jgi:hypothetical protein